MAQRYGKQSQKIQSTKCALDSCGNTVRQDNPTYPYCRHHQGMKTLTSKFNVQGGDITAARETLYAPKATLLSRNRTTAEVMMDGNGESGRKVVVAAYPRWKRNTQGLDMSDPKTCAAHRDRLIDDMKNHLDSTGNFTTDTLRCSGGSTMDFQGESVPLSEHRVILAQEKHSGDNFVIDVAAGAPLENHPEALNGYDSGMSTFSDGLVVSHLAEYAMFSSGDYNKITSEKTGETVWKSQVRTSDTSEVRAARALLKEYGSNRAIGNSVIPAPSREKAIRNAPISDHHDLTLDELLSDD